MNTEIEWLLKLLLSHLIADFILQPSSWVEQKKQKHFSAKSLYLHGGIAALVALLFVGLTYWLVSLVIFITHIAIDGWKSYRKDIPFYFIADQLLHLAVILACWFFSFYEWKDARSILAVDIGVQYWILITGAVLLSTPAGILIGQMTRGWRAKIVNPESLANAGKWIGIIERLIVFLLVLAGQYAAISLLIAAKGIIRFNEKDRPEVKTEYLVIGTLLSIAIAMIVGMVVKRILLLHA